MTTQLLPGLVLTILWASRVAYSWTVYWNVPTYQCKPHKLNFSPLLSTWGIVNNPNDAFRGPSHLILYEPGLMPALLEEKGKTETIVRNGGVPQEGNLELNREKLKKDIDALIPDKNYTGLAVIDFEEWRPIWRQNWGILNRYRTYTRNLEKNKHPDWNFNQIENEVRKKWETSSRDFMLDMIKVARSERPYAKWGFYGYPNCFNYTPTNKKPTCAPGIPEDNDSLMWLFSLTDALFPSIYLLEKEIENNKREKFMIGRLDEAKRIGEKLNIPVFAYVKTNYPDTYNDLSKEDMENTLAVTKEMDLAGVMVWASSVDLTTEEKCQNLYKYVETVLGPAIRKVKDIPKNPEYKKKLEEE